MANDKEIKLDDGFEEITDTTLDDGFEEVKPEPVKKKEEPKLKTTSQSGPSFNMTSSSNSPSSNVNNKVPNFTNMAIPGVTGKDKFMPLTDAQKEAGKKALGQGTTIVEPQKQKIVTPQESQRKSTVLKQITGKDISYDDVNALASPSNTNYAEILAMQKEKPKTDNTNVEIPALKTEQAQISKEQSSFLDKRDFKVNNKQANFQILEEKNPVLLKDIADKAVDLDDKRLQESANTDIPISQRFEKPDSRTPYKPFTDYLDVAELATADYNELYDTREKEADRETQLTYNKERGKNSAFSEFDNEQRAISFKQSALKKKYDAAENNVAQKYGEDWQTKIDQIDPNDSDIRDLLLSQKGLQENYQVSVDLINNDKYKEVFDEMKKRAERQVEIDKDAKEDTWYKFTDEKNKLKNVLGNVTLGLVNDIASLPRFIGGMVGQDGYGWTDKIADSTQRFTDSQLAYYNTPTDLQRENAQDYADVDGYRVFLDKTGNVQSVRDKDNFVVNDDAITKSITDTYNNGKSKYKTKVDWFDGEQVLNQSSKVIGDMLVMMAEAGGIGAVVKGSGKLSGSARLLTLAENAKLTTSLAVITQLQNELMNDAIDKGMSKSDAAKYAAVSGAGVAAISLINPMEAKFLQNIRNVRGLASEEITSFLTGRTTLADLTKKTVTNIIGNSIPEIAEEQFFEPILQNNINNAYKSNISPDEKFDNTDILSKENLSQSVITAATTFLPSVVESTRGMNGNNSKLRILENPENWMAIIDKKKELGLIDDETYSAEVGAMKSAKKKFDALKNEIPLPKRGELTSLITEKVAIENKIKEAPELKAKYEKQIEIIDGKLGDLLNGKSINTSTVGEAVAEEGSNIVTKTDTEIANKISKSGMESLTPEEKDYYTVQKENIDKIIAGSVQNTTTKTPQEQVNNEVKTPTNTVSNGETTTPDNINKGSEVAAANDVGTSQTEVNQTVENITPQTDLSETEKQDLVKSLNKEQTLQFAKLKTPQEKIAYLQNIKNNEQKNTTTPIEPLNAGQGQDNSTAIPTVEQNSQGLGSGNGKGVLSDQKEVQQDNETEKQIAEVKQVIQELEANPNSPFAKLVNLDEQKQKLAELEAKNAKEKGTTEVTPTSTNQPESNPALSDVESIENRNKQTEAKIKNKGLFLAKYGENKQDNKGLIEQPTTYSKKYDANESEAEALTRLTQGVSDLPKEQQQVEIEKRAKEHATEYQKYLDNNPISENTKKLPRVAKFEQQTAKAMQDIIDNPNKWNSKKTKSFENGSRIDENGDVMSEQMYIDLKEKVKSLRKENNLDEIAKINKAPKQYYDNNFKQNSQILDEIKSKNLTHVRGKNMGENQALGTFVSTEKGNRYETADNKAVQVEVDIQNPLVVDNGDFGLVAKRQEILNANRDKFDENHTIDYQKLPTGRLTLDDLNDSGIKKLAELTTAELKSQGYDGIYFRESNTQEGELVVFDKGKVKFKENIINLVEDNAENELANKKLTEQDNIEQEPIIKDIEGKAEGNNEAELNEVVKKSEELINNALDVVNVPISEIKTNENEYQGRKNKFSERSANKVHKQFDKNKFNPIIVYKHPDGNTYVLSGHSRLEGMKRRGEKNIPASYFDGTAQEAQIFAKNSNKLGALQTDLENANYYHEEIKKGRSYNSILEEAKENEQDGSAKKIVSLAHLNPNGKTMDALEKTENSESDGGRNITNIGIKIGHIRALNEHITDAHENELFEYMMKDEDNIPTDKELADQNNPINRSINSVRFDNKQPLNLDKFQNKSDTRIQWEAEKKELEQQVAEIRKDVNPSKKTGWTGLKEKAIASIAKDKSVDAINQAEKDFNNNVNGIKDNYQKLLEKKRDELIAVSNKLAKHLLSEKNLIEGEKNQQSLFQSTDKSFQTISPESFTKLLDTLKKAFPSIKVFSDKKQLEEKLNKYKSKIDLRTPNGTIYGAKFPDGTIYLNTDNLNANTPIHEYGHVFEQMFPTEFERGKLMLRNSEQGRKLIAETKANPAYKGLTQAQIESEALVRAIGDKGESIFNSNPTLLKKFQDWLSDIFAKLADKVGRVTGIKSLQFTADTKLDNFTKQVVGELLGGKSLEKNTGNQTTKEKTIRFQGKDIKVKEINGGAEVVNGFYSPLEKIIGETKFDKLPAKQWLDKFGKGDEAKWTGLTDWLSSQQGSVSKADIQQYLKDNRIQVVEVVKSENNRIASEDEILDAVYSNDWVELGNGVRAKGDVGGFSIVEINGNRQRLPRVEAENLINKKLSTKDQSTKFSQYQLEGEKENYKEVLVTMPTKISKAKAIQKENGNWVIKYPDGTTSFAEYKSKQFAEKDIQEGIKNKGEIKRTDEFKSSHFDEPNILVHLRMNTRTDANGNKVLFLEEVQSDWGQKGKKEGFSLTSEEKSKLIEEHRGVLAELQDIDVKIIEAVDNINKNILELTERKQELLDKSEKLKDQIFKNKAQQAPFVTDTNAWTKLALKVALKEAVKQGADKITWTTGEQQNERYDLSKQVQSISYEKKSKEFSSKAQEKGQDLYSLYIETKESGYEQFDDLTISEVEGYVGKDIANKIQNNEGNKENLDTSKGNKKVNKLTGIDLKVGGKGMKGFYGSPTEGSLGIVGNVAKSLFKQEPKTVEIVQEAETWEVVADGEVIETFPSEKKAQLFVDEGDFSGYNISEDADIYSRAKGDYTDTSTQHSIDITPELKASVESGLPLFQFSPSELQPKVEELRSWDLTDAEIRDYLLEAGNTTEQIDEVLGKEVFGIKKATVPQDVIDSISIDKKSKKEIYETGKENVQNGIVEPKQLVQDVLNGNTLVLDANQIAALIYYRAQIDNKLKESTEKLKNNDGDYYQLKANHDVLLQEEADYHEMAVRTAYNQSIAFSMRKLLVDNEYNAQAQINKYKAVNGGEISVEKEQEFIKLAEQYKDATDKITELEIKIAEYEAQQAINAIAEDKKRLTPTKSERKKKSRDLIAQGLEDLAQLLGSIKMAEGNTMPQLTKALSKIGKGLIESGAATIEDVFDKVKEKVKEKFGDKVNVDSYKEQVITDLKNIYTKATIKDGKLQISNALIKNLVENGYNTVESLTGKLKEIISENIQDVTDRQIHDAITKYGQSFKTREEIDKEITKLKRIMLLTSKIEDARNKKRPQKTGFIREEATPEEREMQKELNELLKDIPLDNVDTEKVFKTALDKVKKRLQNQIKDLENQEKTGIKEPQKKGIEYDEEANNLVKRRDELKKKLEDIAGQTGVSYEQRVKTALRSVKTAIAEYERRIAENDFKRKEQNKLTPTPELAAEKEALKKLKDTYQAMRKDSDEAEAERAANYKKSLQKSIDEYKRRIAEKDFVPKTKKQSPFDEEIGKLKQEQAQIKFKFEKEQELNKIANRTTTEKIKDGLLGIFNIPRVLKTTIDLSAPFRQGVRLMAGHPIEFAKAFYKMHKLAFNKDAYDKFIAEIVSSDKYALIKASGLSITDATGAQKAREEQFWNNIISNTLESSLLNKVTFGLAKKFDNITFKASERGYSGFIDMMRLNVFLDAVKVMERQGITFENNKEAYKELAAYVNAATGRGDTGRMGQRTMEILNTAFFSPKFMKSLYDYVRSVTKAATGAGTELPPSVRKMIVKDFIGFIGVGYMLSALAQAAVKGNDDDDEKGLELDGRSTDFMKVVSGKTRYEMWSGFQPMVRTIWQYITGESKSTKDGSIKKVDGSVFGGRDRNDLIVQFFGNKLSPNAGFLYKWNSGKGSDFEPFDAKKELKNMFIPMSIDLLSEEIANDEKTSKIIIDMILNNYGVSVNNQYDANKTKETDDSKDKENKVDKKRRERKQNRNKRD